MPQLANSPSTHRDDPYFCSLKDLDTWATGPHHRKLDGVLRYFARADDRENRHRGKLLICHDYKGGYTETPSALSYTYNFWSSCDTFVYFSHHRVTVPPAGWITAAHRQGAKILGTLIFEGNDEEDCLRLVVGQLPRSINGPAKGTSGHTSLPLSPHYARLLAELASQRGFDGYLLNFECPLHGGVEQCRTLAAWITLLQSEILTKVGSHGETHWYDSVIFNGQLKWQDRLNSLNLPFFLSSTTIFTNYTWSSNYPNTSAEYFLSLDSVLTGDTPGSQLYKKSLNDIYMGVDVWGRGSHGGGGFGSYKAISHISPDSLGLSVALFGQGWTWESEQDKPGFSWEKWWEYDCKLWVGPISGEVQVPEVPRREGEPECFHGPFQPISSFFPHRPPPDPLELPFHTTFSPGVGRAWFVNGISVYQTADGWTDIDKQCSIGDLLWPLPAVCWDDGERISPLPQVLPAICFDDAWNGGSSIRLSISCSGSEEEDAMFKSVWVPIQTLSLTRGTTYKATLYYKVVKSGQADLDLGFSVKSSVSGTDAALFDVHPIVNSDNELQGGWSELSIQLDVSTKHDQLTQQTSAIGLIVAIIAQDPTQDLDIEICIGQLNIYPMPPTTTLHSPMILWADFTLPESKEVSGILSWEVGASMPPLSLTRINSPDDPVSAWPIQSSNNWFPQFMYYNIYGLPHPPNGHVSQPEEAVWLGTTGLVGQSKVFEVVLQKLPFWSEIGMGKCTKLRFYIQGVTDHGAVLEWEKCVFVDADLQSILA